MQLRPAIFLDKDGTLIQNVPYNVAPEHIVLSTGAEQALPRLARKGYELIVVSNQSGVARGFFDEAALTGVERRLRELFADLGTPLAGFYYCPHFIDGSVERYAIDCSCRKPKPGMLLRAARELALDLSASWMIGDILDDVEAGHLAGCQSILLLNGGETLWDVSGVRLPDAVALDLSGAAERILSQPLRRKPTTQTLELHAHA
jgi:D-glycero-D-manno-heptose 1,7-bisphosphate phosphatase